jgi:uncharacterized membrane protein
LKKLLSFLWSIFLISCTIPVSVSPAPMSEEGMLGNWFALIIFGFILSLFFLAMLGSVIKHAINKSNLVKLLEEILKNK